MFRYLLVLLTFLSLSQLLAYQQDREPIQVKTVMISNVDFLVSDDWGKVPISGQEDLNAKPCMKANLHYCNPSISGTFGAKEDRLTIANQKMELWFDIFNSSKETWRFYEARLEVIKVYSLDSIQSTKGRWSGPRLNSCAFRFKIRNESLSRISTCREQFILKPQNSGDNRFLVTVENGRENPVDNKIYEFRLVFVFNGEKERVYLPTKRSYFLGFSTITK